MILERPAVGEIHRAGLVGGLNYWLMPGRQRPEPRPESGPDPVQAYLDLFDDLAAHRPR